MYIPVEHTERACLRCQQLFLPKRKDKKFCCPTCRKAWGKQHLGHSKGDKDSIRKNITKYKHPYRKFKKLICESCGFVPLHPCQLDVDHINGDHSNNDPTNLQTLCANCHRLKTTHQLGWA